MKNAQKDSETISAFLKLLERTAKEYNSAYDFVNERDKELQDITHKAELESLKQSEKAKLMTELQKNRRERRYWKNIVDKFQPIHELMCNSKEFKIAVNQIKQVLGDVRKAENYLESRTYKPKAKKNM